MGLSKGKKKKQSSKFDDILNKLVDFDEEELWLSILSYGKNGRGKTRFAGTAPNPVFLDFNEKGTLTIRGKGIKGWRIEDWEEVENVYWFLHSGDHDFKTVVWDTGTQAADIALEAALGARSQYDTSTSDTLVTQKDWGNMAKQMRYWITKFRNLEMHKIFLFQEKSLDDDALEEGDHSIVPMVSPSVRASVGAAVDIIIRMEFVHVKKKVKSDGEPKVKRVPTYRARLGPSELYLTKFRMPEGKELPKGEHFVEDPSFDKILDIYNKINQ